VLAALVSLVLVGTAYATLPQTYVYVSKFAVGTGMSPYGMAREDSNGYFYIAPNSSYIAEYNAAGSYVKAIGASAGLGQVVDVALTPTDLYALDSNNGVAKFALSTGALESEITSIGGVPFNFSTSSGVAVDASGNVFIANGAGEGGATGVRVSKFTSGGVPVVSFGNTGATPLWTATSVAVGPTGVVYVADWQQGCVCCYTPTSSLATSYTLTAQWSEPSMGEPTYVKCDPAGDVYVVDTGASNQITKLSPSGSVLAIWGGTGPSNGEFQYATGLAIASNFHVFVADRDGGTVQEFKPVTAATSLTIATSATSVTRGKQFMLSGVMAPTPGTIGLMVHVDVKKPGRSYYSYSSNRVVYAGRGGAASWQYKYNTLTTQAKGTYIFHVVFDGTDVYSPFTSVTRSVTFK
jgi:hypothetical protein